jgi:Zn-dependent alcohol dehydrogenase
MPVVMDDVLAQGGEEMSFAVNEAWSRHSLRAVRIQRSANARGARAGVRTIRTPSAAKTASNDPTNFVSRSRIRNVNWAVRSPRYSLDQVNEGYADMLAGKNIRGVIVNSH